MPQDLATILTAFPAVNLFDRQLLAAHGLGVSREYVLAHPERVLTSTELQQVIELLERRVNHEPIAYILGQKEFYGLDFEVTPATLVPRPETELMIEEAMKILEHQYGRIHGFAPTDTRSNLIVDVGTGSGNIIVTLATLLQKKNLFERARLFALDISRDALDVAQRNATRHNVVSSITFLYSDVLEAFFNNETIEPYSNVLILANLPYLSKDIYDSADPDVRDFEPVTALVSDEAGLAHYRRLLEQTRALFLLSSDTHSPEHQSINLLLEISPEHLPSAEIRCINDLSGRPRLIHIFCHAGGS